MDLSALPPTVSALDEPVSPAVFRSRAHMDADEVSAFDAGQVGQLFVWRRFLEPEDGLRTLYPVQIQFQQPPGPYFTVSHDVGAALTAEQIQKSRGHDNYQ